MATVKLAGREMDVKPRQGPGGLGRMKRLSLAHEALQAAQGTEAVERVVDLVLCYVGHNEGVTREWLRDEALPEDCSAFIRECILASGAEVASSGEAKGP